MPDKPFRDKASPEKVPRELLDELVPIKDLAPKRREALRRSASIQQLGAGQRLASIDNSRRISYLLEGQLSLTCAGKSQGLEAGTPRARQPVFPLQGLSEAAVTRGQCKIVHFDRALYELLLREQRSSYDVVDLGQAGPEGDLMQAVYRDYAHARLHLPLMPEVADTLSRLAGRSDLGSDALARGLFLDPGAAGALLCEAGEQTGGAHRPASLQEAVHTLGVKHARELLKSWTDKRVFKPRHTHIQARMHRFWGQSLERGVFCRVIARRCEGLEAERAALMGLLRDVGLALVLARLDELAEPPREGALEDTLERLYKAAGAMLMQVWQLNPVLYQHEDPTEDKGSAHARPFNYADVLAAAHCYTQAGQAWDFSNTPEAQLLPCMRLGLDPRDEPICLSILDEVKHEIALAKHVAETPERAAQAPCAIPTARPAPGPSISAARPE